MAARVCLAVAAAAVLFGAAFALPARAKTSVTATVYYDAATGGMSLTRDTYDTERGVAVATFEDGTETTGWGVLRVRTLGGFDDAVQMRAAGYAEGALTAELIYEHYTNMWSVFFSNKSDETPVRGFFERQQQWTREQLARNARDPFWQHVGLITAQFDGLVAGYSAHHAEGQDLDVFAFLVLNGVGDLLDLQTALNPSADPFPPNMPKEELRRKLAMSGHCSAFVKVTAGFEDLLMAHSSWFVYAAMLRIYKHYNFALANPTTGAHKVSFSSYPGFLESLDDFYIMDSGLVMLQTTNNIINTTLYKQVVPESLFAWQRVRVACQMARTGREWADAVARHNSGTYNNQYMVIDMSKFHKGESLDDGALVVVEQIPGRVTSRDCTPILRAGYWSSFNVPFFEDIYEISGYPALVHDHGADYSHDLAPRAKIFRRDEAKVTDLDSLKYIMRFNEYKTDPYSEGHATDSICARGDLESLPGPYGCYDTKVTSYALAQNLVSHAVNGPTAQELPPFSWAQFNMTQPLGQPTVFDFGFEVMDPAWDQY